ncbi:MAG: hypothetical protein CL681_19590 [Blastopirellula sp.]|nr:hypothetical protein [Blastopirellula sp.]
MITLMRSIHYFAIFALLASVWSSVAISCDTPVYRYAVYRWPAAAYEVYYLHQGQLGDAETALHTKISGLAEDKEAPANVGLITVDVSADPELRQSVPPDVKAAFDRLESPSLPTYLVVTPYGQLIYAGGLDEAAIGSMIRSPARQKMAQRIEAGDAGVLVMLTCSDKEANAAAEKTVQQVVSDVQEGKLQLYTAPTKKPDEEEKKQEHAVGFVKVARDDPKEDWFVRQLLTIESDLKDIDEPMVFAVFGRGRLLPPCVGRGIQYDNLVGEYVEFMTGACSCTVKDQNPGMDLLTSYNWDGAAESLAAKVGFEEGNENMLAAEQFFPQLSIPTGELAQNDADPAAADPEAQDTLVTDEGPEDTGSADGEDTEIETNTGQEAAANLSQVPSSDDGSDSQATAASAPVVSHSYSSIYIVGAGVAATLVLLFVMTFFVMRPR